MNSNKNTQLQADRELIEHLGGATKVAELLGFQKSSGAQRVHNWTRRGIPASVKLSHPQIFLTNFKGETEKA